MNIEKNVKMGADLAGNKDYKEVINAVGLGGKLHKYPGELSGGEQQRVSVARALAKKPKVLFLDEPTGALDEQTGRQVLDYICKLQKKYGFTIVMVTHNQNIAEMANTVVRMNSGRISGQAFYIKHYIDTHKKELGILKVLGYSRLVIAGYFRVFGIGILLGTLIGFCGAWLLMPRFYEVQNKEKILPEMTPHLHLMLFGFLVVVPTAVFAIISIFYAYLKLNKSALALIKESWQVSGRKKRHREKQCQDREKTFLEEMRRETLREKKTLVFFILFASFCFSSMTQMSFSMDELASEMMGMMIMAIGIILACTTLFLTITTVINGNRKTIAMMRVLGYTQKQCSGALLGGYRPVGYAGFAIGTIYQYVLLKIAVSVFFKDIAGVPVYQFDFPGMMVSLVAFIVIYELIMYCYSERIKKISVKEIMLE